METVDVVIVGGGLAGLVAAIDLSQKGYQVKLFEQHEYPRHKVCGEYVSNEVKPYLKRLGAYPEALQPKQINRFNLSSEDGRLAECDMAMGGFGISRYGFDAHLARRASECGASIETGQKVQDIQFAGDHFQLSLLNGARVQSKLVLGAQGKQSNIDRTLQRKFARRSEYIGVKWHYRADFFEDSLVALHNFSGGYCGLSKVESGLVNLCYLTTTKEFGKYKDVDEFQRQHLSQNPHLKAFLQNAEPAFERPLVISQVSFSQKKIVESGVLMLGDAAGLIHPLCGNGMAMAIHAASIASELTASFFEGRIDRRELERSYTQKWRQNFQLRLRFGRLVEQGFSSDKLTSTGVKLGAGFPALLRKLVQLSHGREIH